MRKIALTFDDGPDPHITDQVVSALDEYGIKGTFFVLGRQVAAHPALAKKLHDGGHLIGNHGFSHPNFKTLTPAAMTEEIERTARQLTSIGIERPRFFRPPYGDGTGPAMDAVLDEAAMDLVLWTIDPRDWELTDPRRVRRNIMHDLEFAWDAGVQTNVIVFHDTYPATPEIIRRLIPDLLARDCTFVTTEQTGEVPDTALANRAAASRVGAESGVVSALRTGDPSAASIPAEVFEGDYRRSSDPFNYEGNRFELTKYGAQIALLAGRRYHSALELGCSIGVFTEMLAPQCDHLLAVDCSSEAIEHARLRCQSRSHVEFRTCELPGGFPDGSFDLITFAEFGYYLARADLEALRSKIAQATKPGATLLVCHMPAVREPYLGWKLPSLAGEVHEMYLQDARWKHISRLAGSDVFVAPRLLAEQHYWCDLFERAGG